MSQIREIAIDIETMKIEEMVSSLPEPVVAYGNTKDPVKRAAKLQEAKDKQIEKMALNPLYGKVISIGAYGDDIKEAKTTNNEQGLLNWFFETVINPTTNDANTLITWNGNNFDLPFIYKRSLILGNKSYKKPLSYWTKRYVTEPHCDLMQVFSNWSFDYNKLDVVANAILGNNKIDIDFKLFPEMMKTEEGQKQIGEYCLYDCQLTYELYQACKGYLFY